MKNPASIIPSETLKSLLNVQNQKIKMLIKSLPPKSFIPPIREENMKQATETLQINNMENGQYIQYSSLYISRLKLCIGNLQKTSQKQWPNVQICKKLLDLKGIVK